MIGYNRIVSIKDATMKSLCVRQPYASDIVNGCKTIEVRSWRTHYRGDLFITSSAKIDPENTDLPCGCIVGIVTVADCRPFTKSDQDAALCEYAPGYFAWILTRPRVLLMCPEVKSRSGLFDLPESLIQGLELVSPHLCNA